MEEVGKTLLEDAIGMLNFRNLIEDATQKRIRKKFL